MLGASTGLPTVTWWRCSGAECRAIVCSRAVSERRSPAARARAGCRPGRRRTPRGAGLRAGRARRQRLGALTDEPLERRLDLVRPERDRPLHAGGTVVHRPPLRLAQTGAPGRGHEPRGGTRRPSGRRRALRLLAALEGAEAEGGDWPAVAAPPSSSSRPRETPGSAWSTCGSRTATARGAAPSPRARARVPRDEPGDVRSSRDRHPARAAGAPCQDPCTARRRGRRPLRRRGRILARARAGGSAPARLRAQPCAPFRAARRPPLPAPSPTVTSRWSLAGRRSDYVPLAGQQPRHEVVEHPQCHPPEHVAFDVDAVDLERLGEVRST